MTCKHDNRCNCWYWGPQSEAPPGRFTHDTEWRIRGMRPMLGAFNSDPDTPEGYFWNEVLFGMENGHHMDTADQVAITHIQRMAQPWDGRAWDRTRDLPRVKRN